MKNTEKAAKKDTRGRNFATIVYPDSAPENWQQIIADELIPCFISPLHDKDVNESTSEHPEGEPKKAHYHVLFMFQGKKSKSQVQTIVDKFGGVGLASINSIRGHARYLCHLDNPEKAQYNKEDVVSLAGADYISIIGLATDKYNAIGEMIDFCEMVNCYSYRELLIYAMNNRTDWYRILCDSGTFVMREYLKSRHWEFECGTDFSCGIADIKPKGCGDKNEQ